MPSILCKAHAYVPHFCRNEKQRVPRVTFPLYAGTEENLLLGPPFYLVHCIKHTKKAIKNLYNTVLLSPCHAGMSQAFKRSTLITAAPVASEGTRWVNTSGDNNLHVYLPFCALLTATCHILRIDSNSLHNSTKLLSVLRLLQDHLKACKAAYKCLINCTNEHLYPLCLSSFQSGI